MNAASSLRSVVALVVGTVLLLGASALTRVPVQLHGDDEAQLRLSWRVDGAVVRECRPPTEEELRRMPAHMVREEICEERLTPYRLLVELDGRELLDREVRPGGLRGDRPLMVHHEVSVPPGEHRVRIRFAPLEEPGEGSQATSRGEAPDSRQTEAGGQPADLPVLDLDAVVLLEGRDVALVTHDRDRGELVVRLPGSAF